MFGRKKNDPDKNAKQINGFTPYLGVTPVDYNVPAEFAELYDNHERNCLDFLKKADGQYDEYNYDYADANISAAVKLGQDCLGSPRLNHRNLILNVMRPRFKAELQRTIELDKMCLADLAEAKAHLTELENRYKHYNLTKIGVDKDV